MRDEIVAPAQWVFDDKVASVFDDMLERSIPDYATMRSVCDTLALRYAKPNTTIVDVGCSTGGAIERLITLLPNEQRMQYVGIDNSEAMIEIAKQKLARYIDAGVADFYACDINTHFPVRHSASVVLCVLTLQFMPTELRATTVAWMRVILQQGGALIFVEKVNGESSHMQELYRQEYREIKLRNGYTPAQVDAKEKSLRNVLVAQTAKANEDMLRAAGFSHVDCVWKCLNFAAWIAVK